MSKPIAYINNWWYNGRQLLGTISHHPRQNEFLLNIQQTSPVISIDEANKTAETENTVYHLLDKISTNETP